MRSPLTARKFAPAPARNPSGRAKKVLKIEAAVGERLAALKQELSSDPGAWTRRRQAARERAARDVHERAGRARAALERLEIARASTDPGLKPPTSSWHSSGFPRSS